MTKPWVFKLQKLIRRLLPKRRLSWDRTNRRIAWCDGLIIGSAPWICYCCSKVRARLNGQKAPKQQKECNVYMLGSCTFFRIHTHRKRSYVWPCVKHVYPGGVLPLLDQLKKAKRIGMPKNLSELVLKSRKGDLKIEQVPHSKP